MTYLKPALIISCLLLIACGKDKKDEDPIPDEPRIQLLIDGAEALSEMTADIGDTLRISARVSAEASIKTFSGKFSIDDTTEGLDQLSPDSATTAYEMEEKTLYIDHLKAEKTISFLFMVTDHLEQSDSVTLVVQVNRSPITVTDSVSLGAYGHSTYGNFYDVLSDTAYFPNNLRANVRNRDGVDFTISYTNDTKFTISSIDDAGTPLIWDENLLITWPFTTVNNTRFILLNDTFDFDGVVTAAQLSELFTTQGSSTISTLQKDQVIAFRLDAQKGGRTGIFKVLGMDGTAPHNRTIYLSLKVQN